MTKAMTTQLMHNTDSQRSLPPRPTPGRWAAAVSAAAIAVALVALVGVQPDDAGPTELATPTTTTTANAGPVAEQQRTLPTTTADAVNLFAAMRDLTPMVSEAINDADAVNPFQAMRDLTPVVSQFQSAAS